MHPKHRSFKGYLYFPILMQLPHDGVVSPSHPIIPTMSLSAITIVHSIVGVSIVVLSFNVKYIIQSYFFGEMNMNMLMIKCGYMCS